MEWFICIVLMGQVLMALSYDKKTPYDKKPPYDNKYNAPTEMPPAIYGGYCLLGNDRVCGTNGFENFLFDNPCEFNEFNGKQLQARQTVLTKADLADCYPPATPDNYKPFSYCPQFCNRIFDPVCASYLNVQRNFSNECELRRHICETQENWQIVLNGTCVDAACSLDNQEVCAWYDNVQYTFPNLMSLYDDIKLTGRNWHILNVGPCPCPTDYRPICAQVGCTIKTFQNECVLQQEIKNASYWTILLYGECPMMPTLVSDACNGSTTPTPPPPTPPPPTPPPPTPPPPTPPPPTPPPPTPPPPTPPPPTPPPPTPPPPTPPPPTPPPPTPPPPTPPPPTPPPPTPPPPTPPPPTPPPPATPPPPPAATTTPAPPTLPANCSASPAIIPIPSINRRPVYIVRQNKILPYRPLSYLAYIPKYGPNTYSPSAPTATAAAAYGPASYAVGSTNGGAAISVYSSDTYKNPAAYIPPKPGAVLYTTPKPYNLVYVQTVKNTGYNIPPPSGYPPPKPTNYAYAKAGTYPANPSKPYSKLKDYAAIPVPDPPAKVSGYNVPIASIYAKSKSYATNPASSSGLYPKINYITASPANSPVRYSATIVHSKSKNYTTSYTTHGHGYKVPALNGYPKPTYTKLNNYPIAPVDDDIEDDDDYESFT